MCTDLETQAEKYMRSVMNHDSDVFSRSDLYEYIIEAYKQGYRDANDVVCYSKRCSQRLPNEEKDDEEYEEFADFKTFEDVEKARKEYFEAKTVVYNKDFESIEAIFEAFPDEQSCIDHLEELRWHGDVVSPFDPTSKVYKCKDNRYRCKNTGKYFNVKTNTLFDSTKVELRKCLAAIWLVTSHKKGISSTQLARDIDVTQKTAWFMLQKIKECFDLDKNNEDE